MGNLTFFANKDRNTKLKYIKPTVFKLKFICHAAPALAGINLSPYLSLLGDDNGLPGLKLNGCKAK